MGNIIMQWLELALNTVMISTVAETISKLYYKEWTMSDLTLPIIAILATLVVRFFTAQGSTRMSYLASKTVKQKLRELIYGKLLRLGSKYREQITTAELVQESVEGVDQLESYFGLYVPQFFYAFIAPITLFFLFGFGGSWATATVLLVCVPLIPGAIMMVQKIAKKLLSKYWGTVRTAWQHLPRKLTGHDHAENLSGRRVQERADERGIRAFPLRDDESPHHAIKLHYHHGLLRIRRGGAWNPHGDKSLC